MLEILERICEGNGTEEDLYKLERLAFNIKKSAICGLGQTAPNPVLSTMKYYLKGTIDKGFYAKFKVLGGVFFSETPIENKPYYTGAGIGIGGILPLFNYNKFYIFADAGLQFAVPFGHRSQSHVKDGSWGMTYYTLLSPASIPDLSIGVALKF